MPRNHKSTNIASSVGIVCAVVGIPTLFILSSFATSWLSGIAPYVLLGIVVVLIAGYNSITSKLLWDFYECEAPWYRFIPCYGELTIMDSKYRKIGTVLYIIALVFLGISALPYGILSSVVGSIAIDIPTYAMLLAFVFLGILQVVKGIGLIDCVNTIAGIWEERNHYSSGFIKRFSLLSFLPYVRVLAIYGLNKPLSTMVSFNNETVSGDDTVELVEED